MDYAEGLTKAVRYGRAPFADVVLLAQAGHQEDQTRFGNTPDAVLADLFADHDDPREEIVRRDLATRERSESGWSGKHMADRLERFGEQYVGSYTNTHHLIDGSRLDVADLFNSKQQLLGHEVAWHPQQDGTMWYMGHFHPNETAALLERLKDHIVR